MTSKAVPLKDRVRAKARRTVRLQGFRLQRRLHQMGWDLRRMDADTSRYAMTSYNDSVPLPDGAEDYLRADNPKLVDLIESYAALDVPAASPSLWLGEFVEDQVSLPWFRGDNAYVWQYRMLKSSAEAKMYLTLLDNLSRDDLGLLSRLDDDGLFGAWTFQYGDRAPVSRDLLDSVSEINYLERQIGLSQADELSVLDIGAGYGRLAHRMTQAFPDIAAYDCMDGVAHSTFLSDYYLRFRETGPNVRALRLDEHQKMRDSYTVAVNIHSFTECPEDAIQWWMDRISERDIEWLLVVPNHPTEFLSTERDGTRRDFRPVIDRAGFELVDSRPRQEDPEMRRLIESDSHYFLFRRR